MGPESVIQYLFYKFKFNIGVYFTIMASVTLRDTLKTKVIYS